MSSESDRFSFQQECEASMWLLADGPVLFSDGVCVFLGNGPSLFGLGIHGMVGKKLNPCI